MLRLVGVLLCCGAVSLVSPVPVTKRKDCAAVGSLIRETLHDVQTLIAKGSSKVTCPNYVMEAEGDVTTYLEGFIKALGCKKASLERRIVKNLEKIKAGGTSCFRQKDWEPEEENDFFRNLEYFLRFLNHYVLPPKTA